MKYFLEWMKVDVKKKIQKQTKRLVKSLNIKLGEINNIIATCIGFCFASKLHKA